MVKGTRPANLNIFSMVKGTRHANLNILLEWCGSVQPSTVIVVLHTAALSFQYTLPQIFRVSMIVTLVAGLHAGIGSSASNCLLEVTNTT